MKSLLLRGYRQLELADLPRPEPGERDALIRIAACGICGSDVHGYDGSSGRRIPPIVMGHEAAGIITAIGKGVLEFRVGDRVTFDSTVYCGECTFCRRGEVNLCEQRQVIGVSCNDYCRAGAFAEYIVVPERILHSLPTSMSYPEAAMLEAVSVALHAVGMSQHAGGETALVVGAGMIGVLTMQAAKTSGFERVIVADIDDSRLKLALALGADEVIHGNGSELISAMQRLTGGIGADIAFEAVGRNETIASSIDSVRKGGTVVLIGNIASEVTLPLQKVVTRQLRLQGTAASAGEYPAAIDLVASGRIRVKPLISAVAPLEDGPQWFERLYAREPNLMKVVLTAWQEDMATPTGVGIK